MTYSILQNKLNLHLLKLIRIVGTDSNVIKGVIYRPPDTDISIFNESLCNILSALQIENKLCYLLGDYNLNLLNTDSHTLTREFVDIMYSYSLLPNITKPTKERSATLIDNIFSNDLLSKMPLSLVY